MTTLTDAWLIGMWLLCLAGVIGIAIACIRGTRKPPGNRYIKDAPHPDCRRMPDPSLPYRIR